MSWPDGVGRIVLPSVDSTMAEARRLAPDTPGDFWVHALTQTAGTGRRGRAWDTGAGNFSASLYLRAGDAPERLALRSFVAALALHDTLVDLTGHTEWFSLKWPNDVLLKGGKLAGILLETDGDAVIVGIGVNLQTPPPPDRLDPAALTPKTLAEMGERVTPERFLDTLGPMFATWETRFRDFGFAPLRSAWLRHAARLGEVLTARLPGEEVVGRFADVDATGALVLETPNGRRAITAGDVFF